MTAVPDASVVVAALIDAGDAGTWSVDQLGNGPLAAPHLLAVETANILRRAVLADEISRTTGAAAHADLVDLDVVWFDYAPFAARVWELYANVTAHDAWYVAVAEHLDAPLLTLDARLAAAPGLRCTVRCPARR